MKKVDAKGGNGNIFFDTEEGTATKYLRNTSSKEKIERFKREQIVLSEIAMHQISNIVEILEVHIDENINESFIKMKKYDGDLSNLFDMTKGNVRLTLELILPVIKSLKILSEYDPPIYHRDIKPENILYKKIGDTYELYLTDFGNCFVKNDDERLTPDNIAVGARMFLAPEYEIGKVEEVTEKGDIFSIGKIIWCMINGNANELLPSSFWYIKEYDLAQKFSNNKEMISANLIISSCLSINPKDRCNYNELIKLIKNTLDENYISTTNEKKLKVKQFQEMRKIKLVEILEKNKLIVNNFSIMFIKALQWRLYIVGIHILQLTIILHNEMKNMLI